VIPLFCSRFLKSVAHAHGTGQERAGGSLFDRFNRLFNRGFNKVLDVYERAVRWALICPGLTVAALSCLVLASLAIYPLLGLAFFPRTDAGQFTINLKVPTGTRIEMTDQYVAKVEDLIKRTVGSHDLKMIVSNIGVVPDFSALYTTNSGPYTATVQVALNDDHLVSSFDYVDRVRRGLATHYPEIRTFFSSGSMVDAILNSGMPAPIDLQVSSSNLPLIYGIAQNLASQIRQLPGVGEVYIPQDMNYPGLRLNVDRVHAGELGLNQKEIIDNVITALNSNYMIAPNYWVDYKTGNDYYLTVQYYEHGAGSINNFLDLSNIPLKAPNLKAPTTLDSVVKIDRIQTPTEFDHYAIKRVTDVYVTPAGEDLGKLKTSIDKLVANAKIPEGVQVTLRGMVLGMQESFKQFGIGFGISFALLFLILVAQFRSFVDPLLILLAIPMGLIGVLVILLLLHTTLNVMSLMGVLLLIGIAASNSILIVDFAHNLEGQGMPVADAVIAACRVRLRPILMTSLATILGMIPMAMKLGTGAEQYAPMAQAIIGGLTSSVLLTVFIVPAAYLLVYGRRRPGAPVQPIPEGI
jgi:multidrug efflux pump subunit AcrB